MATVTGLTAARMQEIIDSTIESGYIDGSGHLILVTYDDTEIDAGDVLATVPDASETVKGIVELATTAEATAGVDTSRAVTPAGLAAAVGTLVPDASTTVKGKVELATTAEAATGTDTDRAVTPAGLKTAIDAVLQLIFPVGAFYMSHSVSTNPNTLLGFGTWTAVTGKVLIGVDGTFTQGSTGGAQTHTIASANLPPHTHAPGTLATSNPGNHTHTIESDFDGAGGSSRYTVHRGGGAGTHDSDASTGAGGHTHTFTGATGDGGFANSAINHMNPWHAAYIWRRTA